MLYSIKNRVGLGKLEKLASLKNQVKELRLQNRLGEQDFLENTNWLFEPLTKTFKNTSRDKSKRMTETSIENNKAIENINNKFSGRMNDSSILATHLMSPLSKLNNPEKTSQFKLVKGPNSKKFNDLSLHNTIPFISDNNLLTFRDTDKSLNWKEIFWKWWLIKL